MKSVLSKTKQTNYIPALVVLMVLLQSGLLLSAVFQWWSLAQLAQKRTAFLQTPTGETIPLIRQEEPVSDPKVIQAFTVKALMLLFNWPGPSQTILGEMEPDSGEAVMVNGETLRVPSDVAVASFLVRPGFQEALLGRIAEVVPRDYFNGNLEVLLVIDEITTPQEIGPNTYDIQVVGHRYTVRDRKLPGTRTPFNRMITVQSVPTPLLPQGDTPLQRNVYGVRQAGLQITNIQPLTPEN